MTRTRSKGGAHARKRYERFRKFLVRIVERSGAVVGALLLVTGISLAAGLGPEGVDAWAHRMDRVVIVSPQKVPETPYGAFSALLEQKLRSRGLNVEREASSGSLANLVRLDEAHGESPAAESEEQTKPKPRSRTSAHVVAAVQADVAYHYVRGGHPQFLEPHDKSKVRALSRLFTERLELRGPRHGTECEELPVSKTEAGDADTRLLSFGSVCATGLASGTMVTTRNLGRVLGASWKDYNDCAKHPTVEQADANLPRERLCARGIAFARSATPDQEPRAEPSNSKDDDACSIANKCMIGFSEEAASLLENSFDRSLYRRSALVKDLPEGKQSPFTIEWDAILVADQELDHRTVTMIHEAVAELTADCKRSDYRDTNSQTLCTATDFASQEKRQRDLPVALHPSVMMSELDTPSYALARLTDPRLLKIILLILLGIAMLAGAMPWVGAVVRNRVHKSLVSSIAEWLFSTRSRWVWMLGAVITFHLLIGVMVWLSELHEHALASDTDFVQGGMLSAADWAFRFAVNGSSDVPLKSTLAVFWVGVLKIGWAVASAALMAGLITAAASGWRTWNMGRKVVIVGWNERGPALVEELKEQSRDFEVWTNTPSEGQENYKHMLDQAPVNFANEKHRPSAIIILGDASAAKEDAQGGVDTWVARQALRLSKLRKDHALISSKRLSARTASQAFRILAEVEHAGNIDIVRASGADDVVCLRRFATLLLAQAATKSGLREVFDDLFKTENDTQEIYFDSLNDNSVATYRTFQRALQLYPAQTKGRIPIGIRRQRKTHLNPTGPLAQLCQGDDLIVIGSKIEL